MVRSERRIRSAAGRVGIGHVPDAEVHWPDVPGSAYPDECWAIEAELTAKSAARTTEIMPGLLARRSGWEPGSRPGPEPRYHRVVLWAAVLHAGPRHVIPVRGMVFHRTDRIARARHPAMTPPRTRIEETVLDLLRARSMTPSTGSAAPAAED